MGAPLTELLQGSFRGVRFLFTDGEKKFGRKNVLHEYPNQDDRYAEDMGLNSDKFSINAIVGTNAFTQNRNALEAALKQPGPGQLVHPMYGTVTVQVGDVTLLEEMTDYGIAKFRIDFFKTRAQPIQPTGVIAGPASLLQQAQIALANTQTWIAQQFNVSNLLPRNFTDAVSLLQGVNSTITGVTQSLTTGSALNSFTSTLYAFSSSINKLIGAPVTLANTLGGIFAGFQTLQVSDPRAQLNLNKQLYNFGDSDTIPAAITAERIQRVKNREVINTATQSMALAYSYGNAATITFLDTDDLQSTQQLLEDQYQKVSELPQISPDVLVNLQTMRNTLRALFADEEVNLFRISTITTQPIPMTVLTYQYYGAVDLVDTLIGINHIDYPAQVSGNVQVFVP